MVQIVLSGIDPSIRKGAFLVLQLRLKRYRTEVYKVLISEKIMVLCFSLAR